MVLTLYEITEEKNAFFLVQKTDSFALKDSGIIFYQNVWRNLRLLHVIPAPKPIFHLHSILIKRIGVGGGGGGWYLQTKPGANNSGSRSTTTVKTLVFFFTYPYSIMVSVHKIYFQLELLFCGPSCPPPPPRLLFYDYGTGGGGGGGGAGLKKISHAPV